MRAVGREMAASLTNTLCVSLLPFLLAAADDDASGDELSVFLLLGQSNMAGQAMCASRSQTTDPRVLNFGYTSESWELAVEPLHHDRPGRNGAEIGTSFARALVERGLVAGKVGLVPCAFGGSSLARWTRRTAPARTAPEDEYAGDAAVSIRGNPGLPGDLYEHAWHRGRLALSAHPRAVLRGILLHHGSTDGAQLELAQAYGAGLRQLIADLRADFDSPEIPFVMGEQGAFVGIESVVPVPFVETIRAQTEAVAADDTFVEIVSSARLGHKGDRLHFSAEAYREFGVRYADVWAELEEKRRVLAPGSSEAGSALSSECVASWGDGATNGFSIFESSCCVCPELILGNGRDPCMWKLKTSDRFA